MTWGSLRFILKLFALLLGMKGAWKVIQGITTTYFVACSGCTKCSCINAQMVGIHNACKQTDIIENDRRQMCPDVQKDTNYSVSHNMLKHRVACCYKHFQPNIPKFPTIPNMSGWILGKIMHKNLQWNISIWWILNNWRIWII